MKKVSISLIPIEDCDKDMAIAVTWQLLSERPRTSNISHKHMPSKDQHEAYVTSHPYRAWYLIKTQIGAIAGAVYLTKNNEVGIAILNGYHRQGYARAAVKMITAMNDPLPSIQGLRSGKYLANVSPDNMPSRNLFEGMGAKPIQITYQL